MPLVLYIFFSHWFGSAVILNIVFQFNCISLGFTIGAVAAILSGKDFVGSVLYCLALNHKQVSLLHLCSFVFFTPSYFYVVYGVICGNSTLPDGIQILHMCLYCDSMTNFALVTIIFWLCR